MLKSSMWLQESLRGNPCFHKWIVPKNPGHDVPHLLLQRCLNSTCPRCTFLRALHLLPKSITFFFLCGHLGQPSGKNAVPFNVDQMKH